MNKKGFTMVELLATIVILGIIMTTAITAYSRYKENSSRKAYNLIHANAASAAENYFMDVPGDNEVDIQKLVELEYLDTPNDPWDKNAKCVGVVKKDLPDNQKKSGDAIELYNYEVQLKCTRGCTCLIYPAKTNCNCDSKYNN